MNGATLASGVTSVTRLPAFEQHLGDADGGEVAVGVVDQDVLAVDRALRGGDLLGRETEQPSSAPGIVCWVVPLRPSAAPARAGRDDDDLGAVLEHSPRRRGASPGSTSTFAQLVELDLAVVDHPRPLAEVGVGADLSACCRRSRSCASTRWTALMPRLPSTIAHSIPAGPAPTHEHVFSAFAARVNCSGCQPRRYSSPSGRVLGADDRQRAARSARRRCCSRCTRGCPRSGPPRSSSAGTGRRSTGARRR